jgi:endonuclease YncB( thermonuclease family)
MYALITLLTTILISIAIIPISPTESLAHRDGCHRWHSCPSDDGSYVCGDLGRDDECGGSEEGNEDNEEDTETADGDSSSKDENDNKDDINSGEQQLPTSSNECQGQADCFTGTVTDIVDGDTLDVNNVRIRLSLVNTPERGDSGYQEAKEFTESTCPVGSKALVDEDDGQKEGSYDRLIGLVYCGNETLLLNEHLLTEGHAQVFKDFCGVSEFSNEDWAKRFGC